MTYTKIETEQQYNEYCDIIIDILKTDKEELRGDELEVLSNLTNAWCDEKYPK